MKTIKSFLTSIFIIILTTMVLFTNVVNASTYSQTQAETLKEKGKIGDIIQLNVGFVRGRNDTFCFEHKTGFSGGQYKVTDIVEINGRNAKSLGTGKTSTKKANVIMNYLLFKGNYRREMFLQDGSTQMSPRNIAIWSYQNTWLNALGNGFLLTNWKHEKNRFNIDKNFDSQRATSKEQAKKLRQEAIDFSNNSTGNAEVSIIGKTKIDEYATNCYGPFKVKATGDSVSLTVTDTNGKIIASNKIKMYSDKACKKSISKINNNGVTTFYIKVTDGTKIKNVTVNTSATVLNAKIFFLAKNDFWSGNGGKGHGQGLILIKPGESKQNKSVENTVNEKTQVKFKTLTQVGLQILDIPLSI